jgi:thiosulfate/3-mercaptopyruvate sulfurtransferase
LFAGVLGALLAGCGDDENMGVRPTPVATSAAGVFPGAGMLVDVAWLRARIDDPSLRLIDCSSLPAYRNGHLPGARHVWWQDTIETNNPVYGMQVGPVGREPILRQAGISPGTTVLAYDRDGGVYAARLLWMLRASGALTGQLLDGGLQAWEAAGGSLTLAEPPAGQGDLSVVPNEEVLAHGHDIADRLGQPGLVILDTRTQAERQETWNDKLRVGAIPGSVWLPRPAFLSEGPVPYLLTPDLLRARLAEAGVAGDPRQLEFVVYGLHGTLAALPWFALTALGVEQARVYDGSWSEWGADLSLPIEPLSP